MGEAKRRKAAGTYPDPAPKRPFLARYDSDDGTISFEAAVERARIEKTSAYAFVPERCGSTMIGGQVWVIAYDTDHDTDPEEYEEICVYHMTSNFGSFTATEDWTTIEKAADELRALRFRSTRLSPHGLGFEDLGIALRRLEGLSRAEALAGAGFRSLDLETTSGPPHDIETCALPPPLPRCAPGRRECLTGCGSLWNSRYGFRISRRPRSLK